MLVPLDVIAGPAGGRSIPEPWLWPPTETAPSTQDPSRVPNLDSGTTQGPSDLATPGPPWTPSMAPIPTPSPSNSPSPALEAAPSPDIPVVAMLRAPKLWPLSRLLSITTETPGPEEQSAASSEAPTATPALDPGTLGSLSLQPNFSSAEAVSGNTTLIPHSTPRTPGSPTLFWADTKTPSGASISPPEVDSGQEEGPSLPDSQTMLEPVSSQGQGVTESPGFPSTSELVHPTPPVPMNKHPSLPGLSLQDLLYPNSTPSDSPEGSLVPGATPPLESWTTVAEPTMGDSDELGSSGAAGRPEPTLFALGVTDPPTSSSTSSLAPSETAGVLTTPAPAVSSSQAPLESGSPRPQPPEAEEVAEVVAPLPEGNPSRVPDLPPLGTPSTASLEESTSTFSGDSPSTLPPASLSPGDGELEVLAGSPGLEGFWEEAASGEEPVLPGTPANISLEEGEPHAGDAGGVWGSLILH